MDELEIAADEELDPLLLAEAACGQVWSITHSGGVGTEGAPPIFGSMKPSVFSTNTSPRFASVFLNSVPP